MSIEQKIAELLEESKKQGLAEEVETEQEEIEAISEENEEVTDEVTEEVAEDSEEEEVVEDAADESEEEEVVEEEVSFDVKDDVAALVDGEELSEEFKQKAETIFEAAVVARVKRETARLEEEFETRLAQAVEKNVEGLVEQVDGYLGYIAEQWIEQNELALERGMKSDILEGFVSGLKGLFEEHYIDVPEERFDVLGAMEEKAESLEEKLDEQVAKNVELAKQVAAFQRAEIVAEAKSGLTDTEVEKLDALVEEIAFEDAETFTKKVQTIRESYFTNKAKADSTVESVVTDEPVEQIDEQVKKAPVDPRMASYMSAMYNK